jgi:hypothetical protein
MQSRGWGHAVPITTLLQVGLETLCVIICSLMLVSVFKTGKRYVSDEEEAEFMARCRDFITDYRCAQYRHLAGQAARRCNKCTMWLFPQQPCCMLQQQTRP